MVVYLSGQIGPPAVLHVEMDSNYVFEVVQILYRSSAENSVTKPPQKVGNANQSVAKVIHLN